MITGNRVNDVGKSMNRESNKSLHSASLFPSMQWKTRRSNTSSEGERLMLEALVGTTNSGQRTVLQYIKMLSVIALPVAAVICLVSYTLHNSRVERADYVVS